MLDLAADVDLGMAPGWPDRYAAGVVEAVRYLRNERAGCSADLMEAL